MSPPAERGEVSAATILDLLLRVAVALFANGQTSEHLARAVTRLGEALGVRAVVFPRWDDLRVRVSRDGAVLSAETLARPTGVDMGKVSAVMGMVAAVRDGPLAATPASLGDRLAEIERAPSVSLLRFVVFAAAGAAALAVIFGAREASTLLLVAASAGAGAALRRRLARLSASPFVQPACAAVLAGAAGGIVARLHLTAEPRLVMVCPCMVLVPGPHLLNGALDLARARISLGLARTAYASVIVLAICVGLLAGLAATGAVLPAAGPSHSAPLLVDVLAAGTAVAAYGTFFSMPWRLLPIPMAVGMAAHALRWLVISAAGASVETGALIASLLVGAVTTPVANRLDLPFAALGFAAVVSLIPGVYLFQMASGLSEALARGAGAPVTLWSGIAGDAAAAFVITLAIALGLILPKMIIEHFFPPDPHDHR